MGDGATLAPAAWAKDPPATAILRRPNLRLVRKVAPVAQHKWDLHTLTTDEKELLKYSQLISSCLPATNVESLHYAILTLAASLLMFLVERRDRSMHRFLPPKDFLS